RIAFTIEDYAVIFSPPTEAALPKPGLPVRPAQAPQAPFFARTFKVDTNTFAAGLESAFGIKINDEPGAKPAARARKAQAALGELLKELGINMEPNKAAFYNELTGVVMVLATPEDLAVVQAAIETLGGSSLEH